jgi:hypothetical protein
VVTQNTGEPFTGAAELQKVRYGPAGRKQMIDEAIQQIEFHCNSNEVGTAEIKIGTCIFLMPTLLSMLAVVKHEGFEDEREWRLTMSEYFGPFSPTQISALGDSGVLPVNLPPMKTNMKFREGGPGAFRPYTEIPFDESALVDVVLGPTVNPVLGASTVRSVLRRHGFWNVPIEASKLPYRP